MTMTVAVVELVHVARLLAETVHKYTRQFGQPALLTVPPVHVPLAFLLLML